MTKTHSSRNLVEIRLNLVLGKLKVTGQSTNIRFQIHRHVFKQKNDLTAANENIFQTNDVLVLQFFQQRYFPLRKDCRKLLIEK